MIWERLFGMTVVNNNKHHKLSLKKKTNDLAKIVWDDGGERAARERARQEMEVSNVEDQRIIALEDDYDDQGGDDGWWW